MRPVMIMLIVGVGLVAGAVGSATANHWPSDLWERLQREGP